MNECHSKFFASQIPACCPTNNIDTPKQNKRLQKDWNTNSELTHTNSRRHCTLSTPIFIRAIRTVLYTVTQLSCCNTGAAHGTLILTSVTFTWQTTHQILIHLHRKSKKHQATILLSIFLSNADRLSKLFHWQTQQEICNKICSKDPTKP